jgi:hypothetical protein
MILERTESGDSSFTTNIAPWLSARRAALGPWPETPYLRRSAASASRRWVVPLEHPPSPTPKLRANK